MIAFIIVGNKEIFFYSIYSTSLECEKIKSSKSEWKKEQQRKLLHVSNELTQSYIDCLFLYIPISADGSLRIREEKPQNR